LTTALSGSYLVQDFDAECPDTNSHP
jgi:hypothetical protein